MRRPGSCLPGSCRFLGWVEVLPLMATPSRLCRQPLPAGAIFLRTRETFPPAGAICLTPLPIPTASCCLATARAAILRPPVVGNDYNPETSPFESVRTNGTDYILTAQDMADYIDMYRSSVADLTNPYFAPLTAHDLSNQPRTLVLSAEYCPLRDEDEAYARRLQLVNDNVSCYRIHDGIHGYLLNTSAVGLVATTYRIIEHFLGSTPLEPAPGTGTTANAPEGGDAWQDVLGTD